MNDSGGHTATPARFPAVSPAALSSKEEICKVLLCRLAPSVSFLIPFLKCFFNKHYETDTRGCLQKQIHLSSNVDSYFGHLQKSPMLFFPPILKVPEKMKGMVLPYFLQLGEVKSL